MPQPKLSTNAQQLTAEDRADLVQLWAVDRAKSGIDGVPRAQCRLVPATFKIAIRTHVSYIINKSCYMCKITNVCDFTLGCQSYKPFVIRAWLLTFACSVMTQLLIAYLSLVAHLVPFLFSCSSTIAGLGFFCCAVSF